jgi:Ca2+-binding RTX toxin-like protein
LGDDVIFGRENDDFIAGQDGNDALYGGVGEDRIDGGDGNEVLSGNEGADQLDGGLGADTLSGGNGDDSYIIDNIADLITGETATSGIDSVISSVSLNLVNSIEDLTLIGTGNITGAGNDLANVLVGNDQKNILNGLGNDDTIYGNGGDDTLKGGTGNDFLDGGFAPRELIVEGSTAFILSGLDLLEGGAGNDTYVVSEGDIVTENLNEGNDTAIAAISYVLPKNVENLSLVDPTLISEGFVPGATNLIAGRDDAGDALLARREADLGLSEDSSSQKNRSNSQPIDPSILMATGNEVGNRISGNNDRNRLKGLDGNDTLEGSGGDDTIFGNEGNDSLSGGEGNDRLTGNNGQDILTGNNGDDYLVGGKGNDRINGDDGNDYLIGGRGADTLNGGKGDDVLLDGGKSLLTGGEGKDTFVVSGLASIITDFKIHEDSLKFEDLEEEYDDRLAISQVGQDTAISLDRELVVTLQGVNARSFIDSNHSFFWQKN